MKGLMMDYALTVPSILRRAAQVYPEKEIVSRMSDGSKVRITYREMYERVIRLVNALREMGVKPGDRVATCAWNSYRHTELYFAVPSIGAILHTVNFRLFSEQVEYIINHAEDKVMFLDSSLAPMIATLQPALPCIQHYVVMDDKSEPPTVTPTPFSDYEALLAGASSIESFPDIDENLACGLCYTSGTTGQPKGVLYSHRSNYLHAMGECMTDSFGISERDTVLPVVPMFHANAWGLPYSCAMVGAKQVLPGSHLLGSPIANLMESERVTFSAGVPTVWRVLYQHLKQHKHDLSSLRLIVSGGSAAPLSLIEGYKNDFGITLTSVWGMTETSPVGTLCRPRGWMDAWTEERRSVVLPKQGTPVPGIEVDIRGENNEALAWDGQQAGEVVVRGPWVVSDYFKNERTEATLTPDGWFRTGDIARMDKYGYMEITDRTKDIIKSRGEWISSVDMENLIVQLPKLQEACVVGRTDVTRGEAPVVFAVLKEEEKEEGVKDEILALLATKFAGWQIPKRADIHFIDAIPKTSVGKLNKKALRATLEEGS